MWADLPFVIRAQKGLRVSKFPALHMGAQTTQRGRRILEQQNRELTADLRTACGGFSPARGSGFQHKLVPIFTHKRGGGSLEPGFYRACGIRLGTEIGIFYQENSENVQEKDAEEQPHYKGSTEQFPIQKQNWVPSYYVLD